jgi:hypothetical protein
MIEQFAAIAIPLMIAVRCGALVSSNKLQAH